MNKTITFITVSLAKGGAENQLMKLAMALFDTGLMLFIFLNIIYLLNFNYNKRII